jgi:hypothetical protein
MDEDPATPFDDFAGPNRNDQPGKHKVRFRRMHGALRVVSTIAFVLAISSACVVLVLDCLHFFGLDLLPWRPKSAFPLIFVGISYGCLQFTLPRSWKEFALSLAVGAAFILWGVEQFVPYPALASLMDDVVVFLFVLDLSIVIRGNLKYKKK